MLYVLPFLILVLSLFSYKVLSHSQYDSLQDIDEAINNVETIVSNQQLSLSGAISLSILYYIRDDQFMQGGSWQALYYVIKALSLLKNETDPSINRRNLHYALFMHQQKLLNQLGRSGESLPQIEIYYKALLKLPISLPHRRRLSMVSLALGDASQAMGKLKEAKDAFYRAIEEFPCNHQAYYKLAQTLSMLKSDEDPLRDDAAFFLRERTEEAMSKLLLDTRRNRVIFEDVNTFDAECETGDNEVNNMDELFKHSSISSNASKVSIAVDAAVMDKLHHLRLVLSTFHWTLYLLAELRKDYNLAWFHMSQMRFLERFRLSQSTVYNSTSNVNKVAFIKTHITPDYWPRKKSQWIGLSEERLPVFIVGFFRSGSTLLESLLSMHPQIWGMGESSVLTYHILQMQSELSALTSISDSSLYLQQMSSIMKKFGKRITRAMKDRYQQHYLGLSTMRDQSLESNYSIDKPANVTRIVDKMLLNYLNIPFIHLMFPNAIVLHMVRDPLDTLLSCMKNRFGDHSAYTLEFRTLVAEYVAYLEMVGHLRKALPRITFPTGTRTAMIDVRYEELVADPSSVMRRVFSSLGVSIESVETIVESFHLQDRLVRTASFLQVKQPIYLKSIGGWRKYESQFQQTLIPELRQSLLRLSALGYLPFTRDEPGSPRMNWELSQSFNYTEMINKFT